MSGISEVIIAENAVSRAITRTENGTTVVVFQSLQDGEWQDCWIEEDASLNRIRQIQRTLS